MTRTATIDAVLRTLADPTRRAVFERIVRSDEITVVELTQGSGVTQGAVSQHLKSLNRPAWSPTAPRGGTSTTAPSRKGSRRWSIG